MCSAGFYPAEGASATLKPWWHHRVYLTFWRLEKHRNRVGRKRFQLITFLYSIFLISAEALTVSSPVSADIRGGKQKTQRQTRLLKSKCTSFGSWIYWESGWSCFFQAFSRQDRPPRRQHDALPLYKVFASTVCTRVRRTVSVVLTGFQALLVNRSFPFIHFLYWDSLT